MTEDLPFLSLLEVSERIRRRELSAERVTRAMLERIAALDPKLRSFQVVRGDAALAEARAADAEIASGAWRGPLHGVPVAIKDLLHTKDEPTGAGTEILRNFMAGEDATAVRRLKRAGAVIVGKLTLTEGATLDHHPDIPHPVNPWSAAHWPGASSSGSGVSVAAGLCYGALGTDTAGSIRMPSAANNLTGIKPTWGRVSRHGLFPLAASYDHLGPMARSAGDAAAMLQAIAGADAGDPTALPEPVPDYLARLREGVSGLVIGVDWSYATEGVPAPIAAAVRAAAEVFTELGAQVREISLPSLATVSAEVTAGMTAEIAAAHIAHFPAKAERYGPKLRGLLETARGIDGVSVALAHQARERFKGEVRALFRGIDLMLTPGLGVLLPSWEEFEAMSADFPQLSRTLMRFTTPFNAAGVPTISIPGGFTGEGLPIGLQLIGPWLGEPDLVRAAHAFQTATDFHRRRPPLD